MTRGYGKNQFAQVCLVDQIHIAESVRAKLGESLASRDNYSEHLRTPPSRSQQDVLCFPHVQGLGPAPLACKENLGSAGPRETQARVVSFTCR